jgi:hypothetical protein
MPEQLFAIIENPTTPWRGRLTEPLCHPHCTPSDKPRFSFRCWLGLIAKSIPHLGQRAAILQCRQPDPHPSHFSMVRA